MTIPRFQKIIVDWYKTHGRNLPWRNTKDPYKILVSEIMLQQTQVSRVLPKYKEFLKAFPSLSSLARAKGKRLLKVWQGLGYWRRAKYLKQIAKRIVEAKKTDSQMSPRRPKVGREHRSHPPVWADEDRSFENLFSKPESLETLPGIGRYTARAIACFAFGNSEAFLDTNIRRVYLHFFFPKRRNVSDKEILPVAQRVIYHLFDGRQKNTTARVSVREWHYALFDYGAAVLKDRSINKRSKHYAKQSRFEGSFRSFRTKVMQFLLMQKNGRASLKKIRALLQKSPYPSKQVIDSLLKDNLIKKLNKYYSL